MVGGCVESLGNNAVCFCCNKVDVLDLDRPGTEAVEFGKDGTQFLFGRGIDPQAGITRVGLLLADIKDKDLEVTAHIHNPVEELGHDP